MSAKSCAHSLLALSDARDVRCATGMYTSGLKELAAGMVTGDVLVVGLHAPDPGPARIEGGPNPDDGLWD
eukprot:5280133-Pleurochrysis_carterae.AAC.1